MPPVNERMLLIFILVIVSIAILLCLAGLATSGWDKHHVFYTALITGVLIIISVLLLIICIVILGIMLSGTIIHQRLPFIFVLILVVSSIIMLGGFSSFSFFEANYSYGLMVAAFTFTYLSSILATYWLFGVHVNSTTTTVLTSKHLKLKLDVLT